MKRKSEQLSSNFVRTLKKNMTLGNHKKKHILNCHQSYNLSQIIVAKIVQQIADDVQLKIKTLANNQLINLIVGNCEFMANNLRTMIYPQVCQNQNCSMVIDKQPQRILYDPICGFDKLVTIKNDRNFKFRESQYSQSKSKAFGVFQIGKKRPSFSKNASSTSFLIPLDSLNLQTTQTRSQKQSQKQQIFYRDRIYDSGLPILVPDHRRSQNKMPKLGIQIIKQNINQNCLYDYNGDKHIVSISAFPKINSSNFKKPTNNVLKTVIRVIDHRNQDEKKSRASKNITSRISKLGQISSQIIKSQNLKSQNNENLRNSSQILKFGNGIDGGQMVKNLLEATFKEKHVIFKPIQRTHRISKLL